MQARPILIYWWSDAVYTVVQFRDRDQDLMTVGIWPATISNLSKNKAAVKAFALENDSKVDKKLKSVFYVENVPNAFQNWSETVSIPDSNETELYDCVVSCEVPTIKLQGPTKRSRESCI